MHLSNSIRFVNYPQSGHLSNMGSLDPLFWLLGSSAGVLEVKEDYHGFYF